MEDTAKPIYVVYTESIYESVLRRYSLFEFTKIRGRTPDHSEIVIMEIAPVDDNNRTYIDKNTNEYILEERNVRCSPYLFTSKRDGYQHCAYALYYILKNIIDMYASTHHCNTSEQLENKKIYLSWYMEILLAIRYHEDSNGIRMEHPFDIYGEFVKIIGDSHIILQQMKNAFPEKFT